MTSFSDPSTPFIALVSGPPGAGKSTIARLVADEAEPSVHMEADEFWHFIRRGFAEPWLPESRWQNQVVVQAVARAAESFAAGGFAVVVDWVLGPWHLEQFLSCLTTPGLGVAYVVLRPRLDVALQRATGRPDRPLREHPVRKMHSEFADLGAYEAHALDTSELGIEDTARLVLERLRDGSHLIASPE
jgi:chloramphenicol 3-O-phosphotransferase